MPIHWTSKALSDLGRLHAFLVKVSPQAASQVVRDIVTAPEVLSQYPRLGEPLQAFQPRDVRRMLVGEYELRYEIQGTAIYILRVWHTRQGR